MFVRKKQLFPEKNSTELHSGNIDIMKQKERTDSKYYATIVRNYYLA